MVTKKSKQKRKPVARRVLGTVKHEPPPIIDWGRYPEIEKVPAAAEEKPAIAAIPKSGWERVKKLLKLLGWIEAE